MNRIHIEFTPLCGLSCVRAGGKLECNILFSTNHRKEAKRSKARKPPKRSKTKTNSKQGNTGQARNQPDNTKRETKQAPRTRPHNP